MNKSKIVTISGPTASGKTKLAIKISKHFPSVLISADSRQVFRGMNIVTGKDHTKGTEIFGIDIVDPDEECSVALWHKSITPILTNATKDMLTPIIIGGTGLYIKSITNNLKTISIPRDDKLRIKIQDFSVSNLQKMLIRRSPSKLDNMNNSDRNNPRRLIRAIEVASAKHQSSNSQINANFFNILLIPDMDNLKNSIEKRVLQRINEGAIEETKVLLSRFDKQSHSFSAIGYKHILEYLSNDITKKDLAIKWAKAEFAYAKRQLTWYKKLSNTHIYKADNNMIPEIVKNVKTWYSEN